MHTLAEMIQATGEFQVLHAIGRSLQDIPGITDQCRQVGDYLCAMVPDEVVERYGVLVEVAGPAGPHCWQLKLSRGYEVHLFSTGNKYLLANDGSGRYLNADRSAEVAWCGPSPASSVLFTVDLASGLVSELDQYVKNYLMLTQGRD